MQRKLLLPLLFFAASLNTFVSSCTDITVNGGQPWYDSDGPMFDCAWYGQNNYCASDSYKNFGLLGKEACCVCGGGLRNPTTSPSPTTLSLHPTSSPTSCTDKTVNDSLNDGLWYDLYGYSCSSYEFYDRCTTRGHMYENYGMTANEACCVCGGGQMIFPTLSPQPSASPYPNSTPSSWNNNDDTTPSSWNNNDDVMDPTTTVLAVVGAIVALWLVIGCIKVYAKNSSRNSHNNASRSTNLRTRPAQRTPQQTQHAGSSIVDERDIRRQFILTNIIHKKVVTKSSQSSDDSGESVITGTIADNSQNVEIDEGEVIFPHEAIVRERSERIASMRLSMNHDLGGDGDEEQGHGINDKKEDICIETLRSIRTEMNIHLDMDSLDESLYSPKSCPICCEDYVKGDDVAWSKNEECCHAFHTDCIVPWLMDHDDCPMCRCVYVKEGERDVADC